MNENEKVRHVYTAINAVQDEIAKIGIQKDKKNEQQGYKFRGIDDVYNALAPLLAKHKLCIIPAVIGRTMVERQTRTGGSIFYVTVECEFYFVSAVDGSRHIAKTFGEAMDSADKATNKAMSAAYKYLTLQTFCIPVEGQDADVNTPPETIAANAAAAKAANEGRKEPPWAGHDPQPAAQTAGSNAGEKTKAGKQETAAAAPASGEGSKAAPVSAPEPKSNEAADVKMATDVQKKAIVRLAKTKGQNIDPVALDDYSFDKAAAKIKELNTLEKPQKEAA
jgi:hypothetical protein